MNAHLPISNFAETEMTADGEVTIPKSIRDAAGLVPGGRIVVGVNDRGEVVVLSRVQAKRAGETRDERRARIRKALDGLAGSYSTGQSTGEIMDELRGDRAI